MPSFCDSRCTGASGKSCDCECGGANHGASKQGKTLTAIDRTGHDSPSSLTDAQIKREVKVLKDQAERAVTSGEMTTTEIEKELKSIHTRSEELLNESDKRSGKDKVKEARAALGQPTPPTDEMILFELDKFDLGSDKMVGHLTDHSNPHNGQVNVTKLKADLLVMGRLSEKAERAINRAVAKAANPPKSVAKLEELVISDRVPEDLETEARGLVRRSDAQGAKEFLSELKLAGFLD